MKKQSLSSIQSDFSAFLETKSSKARLAKRSNIVCQTFGICLSNNVWTFCHVIKHCWTSMLDKYLLENVFENFWKLTKTFSACRKQKFWQEIFFWHDQKVKHCVWQANFLFDKQCLVVWRGYRIGRRPKNLWRSFRARFRGENPLVLFPGVLKDYFSDW